MLGKIATQTVVSSHVEANIIRTIAYASIKTMTKNWHIKLKEIYYTYVQKTSMIFVHDSPQQKQKFLNLIACHIHLPSQVWNNKIDND